jgi:chromosome segregation ATPase
MAAATISVDEFQALEQKVLQTVELIKKERELRSSAEARVQELEAGAAAMSDRTHALETQKTVLESERDHYEAERNAAMAELATLRDSLGANKAMETELEALRRERESVRQRVEVMLAQMDELV